MALVGECQGWDKGTEMLSHWQDRQDVSPYSLAKSVQPASAQLDTGFQPDPTDRALLAGPDPRPTGVLDSLLVPVVSISISCRLPQQEIG